MRDSLGHTSRLDRTRTRRRLFALGAYTFNRKCDEERNEEMQMENSGKNSWKETAKAKALACYKCAREKCPVY